MGSSDSDGQVPTRKRLRTSTNSEDAGGKKARGRPRVDTQDETAADRRRTQIRLAQRAYRQRKETTIASLKQQNDRLQSIIDQMNKSFLQFNEAALKSGLLQLNPVLAQQLKSVTESFVSLAKSAAEGNDDEEEASEPMEAEPTQSKQSKPTTPSIQPQHVDLGWGYSASVGDRSPPRRPQDSQPQSYVDLPLLPNPNAEQAKEGGLMRYNPFPPIPDLFNQGISWGDSSVGERPSDQPVPFGIMDILSRQEFKPPTPSNPNPNVFFVAIPTPRASPPMTRFPTPPYLSLTTKTPKPIWTYSHEETTFGRRLTRASLEMGFHTLGAAHQISTVEYLFRLSLSYITLNEIRETLKEILARGTDEELDNWSTPFIHLGGAGTHYPRRDEHGNIVKRPNSWTVRRIGPVEQKMARAENVEDPSQWHDLKVDLTGYEGEWFDAYDVEGYLEQVKGVRIDPKSSFQDAVVDDEEYLGHDYISLGSGDNTILRRSSADSTPDLSAASSSADARSSSSTPPMTQGATDIDHFFAPSDIPFGLDMSMGPPDFNKLPTADSSGFFDQPLGLDLAPSFDTTMSFPPLGFSDNTFNGGGMGMNMAYGDRQPIPIRQRRKKRVLIDVSKLVDEIVKHAVCLGRAPGFRRKDVDIAFQSSLVTAF
ncbi:hypothetical protein BU23DRAFT_555779 [Bimuria novae-zelandiae CBS 107.79]|uniref:BZIP domain-containing protein n=1 Tax=Bimuria novae-zelandiae CBS 107.79 TaxID=1447943 RepID=A0A6A5V2C8_9PLEO|nr:hypothetical protein BU23DRAFT_555779 [Bimuria novae-zelandiae CBS 107.79]